MKAILLEGPADASIFRHDCSRVEGACSNFERVPALNCRVLSCPLTGKRLLLPLSAECFILCVEPGESPRLRYVFGIRGCCCGSLGLSRRSSCRLSQRGKAHPCGELLQVPWRIAAKRRV